MIKNLLISTALFVALSYPTVFAQEAPGFWQNPVIKGAGGVHPLPKAAFQPDKAATYKAMFVIDSNDEDPQKVNYGFKYVALAVNAFASAGVPTSQLKFMVIIRGAAPVVLDNTQYQNQFHTDNPNLKLIHELEAAGVRIVVCGQSVAGYHYSYSWIDTSVKVALSGLSTIIILQQQGYALIQL